MRSFFVGGGLAMAGILALLTLVISLGATVTGGAVRVLTKKNTVVERICKKIIKCQTGIDADFSSDCICEDSPRPHI